MSLDLRYRFIDIVRGTRSHRLLTELRRWQYESPQLLYERQESLKERYLTELKRSLSIFGNPACFEDLPIIDKTFINTHRQALMNPSYKGRMIRKKTGGSTGEPLVYFTGVESQSYLWAGIFLAWEAAGYKLGDRVAFLAGSSVFKSGGRQQVYYRLLNVTLLSAFDMSAARMRSYVQVLRSNGIYLLYGYASAIHRLALFILNEDRPLTGQLRGVVCTAEMLTEVMRVDIEKAFAAPCFNQYGCHEAGVSAFECEKRNGLHLLSTRSYAEVSHDGRLISTDLANDAMFMPRCDTGDIVRMSHRVCSCGRGYPLIDEVVGRQNDMVCDRRGKAVHSEFFTHLFREDQRILSFQVLFDENDLTINIHTRESDSRECGEISQCYKDRIAATLNFQKFDFTFNEPFVRLANGKRAFVMRRRIEA